MQPTNTIILHPLAFLRPELEIAVDTLNDACLSIDEMIELALKSIHYKYSTDDRVENYLYYWVYANDPQYHYRQAVAPNIYNDIKDLIEDIEVKIRRLSPVINMALEGPPDTSFSVRDECLKVRIM